MEKKKTIKADLESKKKYFFLFGLFISLTLTVIAFNLRFYEKEGIAISEIINMFNHRDEIIKTKIFSLSPPVKKVNITEIKVTDNKDIKKENIVKEEKQEQGADDAAKNNSSEAETDIYLAVEEMPSFPGGEFARIRFIQQNVKYPFAAVKNHIEGKVIISFIIEKDGSVSNIKLSNSIGGGCDEEALRVVRLMPKWIPGRQKGNPVRVQFNMPVNFRLRF
ncbi:MAG: energy transducer TonB [Bacteroidales bacterium]|nr:energy transducer TonB [Bacteroidales bacterium]